MYKTCIMEDSAKRQRELEQGFLAILRTQAYEDLSISDLCRQLSISRKSFYRYFSGKEGALAALLDHTLMDFEACSLTESVQEDAATKILELFFNFWEKQKPLLDVLKRDGLSMVLYQRALELSMRESSIFSQFTSDRHTHLHRQRNQFIVCGMMTMMISWHHNGYHPPLQKMAESANQLLTQPLFQK